MGTIRRLRREHSVGLISDSDYEQRTLLRYCDRCLGWGQRVAFGDRLYQDSTGKSIIPPPDAENWLQCPSCASIYAKYEVKIETDMGTLTEPSDSPFSSAKDEIKGISESRGYDRSGKTQARKKKKQDLSEIKDQELRKEIASGAKLLSYHEFK